MKVPCCSVCQCRYNDEDRVPLLLQCGHGFCRECLSRMFSASLDTTLACPRCRHVSVVGNSVSALRKNFPILSLLHGSSSPDADLTLSSGSETEDEDAAGDGDSRRRHGGDPSSSSSSSRDDRLIELGLSNLELKLVKKIGEARRAGVEVWAGTAGGGGGAGGTGRRWRKAVAVKKVEVTAGKEMDWVVERLEELRRKAMWCRNICRFHGVLAKRVLNGRESEREKGGDFVWLVWDRCSGSVMSEMQRNEGRLTLDQILRYGADIARGVAELHAAGIVCMNLKPSNLLLDANGHALVSDYGLASILKKTDCRKARIECESSRSHSCMDCAMLSPQYAAPEAWEPVKKSIKFWGDGIGISPASDAWSFGCTLVEMCTGSAPWVGLSAEEIYQAVVKAGKRPPQYTCVVGVGMPTDLWKMIGECLHFKAASRPSFSAILSMFMQYLQKKPWSPPASPENDSESTNCIGSRQMEPRHEPFPLVVQNMTTLLHRLVSEGNVNGVRDLLNKAASGKIGSSISSLLEAQNSDGQTALHLACRRGNVELVETILEHREANVDILNKDGDPPLVFALAAGNPVCVRALIRRSANVKSRLRDGASPSIAHVYAYHGQPDCMRELLLGGADPNVVDEEGESVLHRAVAKKYTDCAMVILDCGGSLSMSIVNSKNLTPLHLCVATYNVAVVKRWLEVATPEDVAHAIDVPSPAGTALCMAASLKKDHESEGRQLVRLLLGAGADPTAQDAHGRTVLHSAAMADDTELVKIILEGGVDVNIRNVHNMIPLHVALARGAKSCVGLLLYAGANCNLQDDEGDNAFHIAAESAKMIRENLQWLIVMLRHPDSAVEARNHSGKTLRDYLEALPREWISEDLMEALMNRGVHLSPTLYDVGDWVKFKRTVVTPTHGWQGASHKSVGFVQNVQDKDNLTVSFCSGEARVLASEVIKVVPLDRGQHVRLKAEVKEPRFELRGQSRDSIGTVLCVDDDGILRVGFPGASRGWKVDPAEMERVEEFKVGDWVRIRPSLTTAKHGLGSVSPGSIGIVYCIRPDSSLLLDLCYLPTRWPCEPEEVEHVVPFMIGDLVCVKRSVAEPRYAWGGETHHSVGKICDIESDGLLIIEIPNRNLPWRADPSDMDKVEDFKVGNWVRVKASVPSPKYGWDDITRESNGIIHSLEEDGDMCVAFCFRSKSFRCSVTDMEKVSPFEVGQEIHMKPSISQPQLGWSNETPASVGKIVRIDMDGALNVKVAGRASLWRVSPGDVEQLSGFEVGDWVRSKPSLGTRLSYDWNSLGKDSIAVVHSVQESGYLELACCFRKGRPMTHFTDIEKVPSFKVGQRVKFRPGISEPRWGWRGTGPDSHGVIASVHADGEVRVAFSGLPGLRKGDPADLELEQIFEVGEWVRLKENASKWKSITPGCIGTVQGLGYEGDECDGTMYVAFCGEQERWVGPCSNIEKVRKLKVGQQVKVKLSVKQPRFGWSGHSHLSIRTISAIDGDGKLRIYTPAGSKAWMLDPSEVEIVQEEELQVGDWVRVKPTISTPTYHWGEVSHSSIGVVSRIDGAELWVTFCFMDKLWLCKAAEMERVRQFRVGDKVKIKEGLITPRWDWGMETHASKGEIVGVDANGKLRIKFQWREGRPWIGDPADIMLDESSVRNTGL
ncbi:hypothetical protein MLD38_008842 [Melastoma candidum]|uniref:Uncharacterized protein n=2 Tax=Melastoma candidum TaxID=119954 RepID=A0ACB9RZZ5_9MYRT|nr:hypothetical protein MLD38_008842 [Melastoma candidum]